MGHNNVGFAGITYDLVACAKQRFAQTVAITLTGEYTVLDLNFLFHTSSVTETGQWSEPMTAG